MVSEAGFPSECTVEIYDSATELESSSNRLDTNPSIITTQVSSFEESGFENRVKHIETLGGNRRTVANGRTPITISLHVRIIPEDVLMNEVYNQIGSPGFSTYDDFGELTRRFYLHLSWEGLNRDVYYYNLVPVSFNESAEVDGILEGTITFTAPAWDAVNSRWNKEVVE
jgi:hypothetical protein